MNRPIDPAGYDRALAQVRRDAAGRDAALFAELARQDALGPRTAHWTPRGYEGLADSIAAATAHQARFGYGEDR